ncbi:hypothetical protein NL676_025706 [Syzygium grande]|nr:hypothetical protein NL676_025706 [Syzygium grande]
MGGWVAFSFTVKDCPKKTGTLLCKHHWPRGSWVQNSLTEILYQMNGYVYRVGLGICDSGVEVHGVEYAFGDHDYPSSGVFEVEPWQCPGFKFRKSIFIGTTSLDPTEDVCHKLVGKLIPKCANWLPRIGSACNLLPKSP